MFNIITELKTLKLYGMAIAYADLTAQSRGSARIRKKSAESIVSI